MTISGLPTGEQRFEVQMDNYETEFLQFDLNDNQTVEKSVSLLSFDRIVTARELDVPPFPLLKSDPIPPIPVTKEVVVVVTAMIDRDGTPKDISVVRSDNREFNDSVIEALSQWHFKPGVRKDREVRARVNIPFRFAPGEASATMPK